MQKQHLTINWTDRVLIAISGVFFVTWTLSLKKLVLPYYTLGVLNEFGSVFIYLSDVAATVFVGIFIIKYNKSIRLSINQSIDYLRRCFAKRVIVPRGTMTFAISIFVVYLGALISSFSIYHLIHFLKLLVLVAFIWCFYLFITKILCKIVPRGTILKNILIIIVISGFVNALVAIFQFCIQSSIKLHFLRESIIDVHSSGVAKISFFDNLFIRPYGLLPHPNILAGVLLLTITTTITLYYIEKTRKIVPRGTIFLFFVIFLVQMLAFALSFSRSAFVAAFFGVIAYVLLSKKLFHVEQLQKSFARIMIILVLLFSVVVIYSSSKVDCNDTFTQSLCERSLYAVVAIQAIGSSPGLGSGTDSAVIVDKYVDKSISVWQYQPAHNIFLLITAENGIVVLFIFLCIIYNILKIVPRGTIYTKLYGSLLVTYLVIGCFDHYLWDMQQGFIALLLCCLLIMCTKE